MKESEPSYRTIHPYGISIKTGQWYLIALDEEKAEFRTYHFLRIKELAITERLFTKDPHFQFEQFFEKSWGVFQGPVQTIELKVRGMAARLIKERSDPKNITIQPLYSGEYLATITVSGEPEIMGWGFEHGNRRRNYFPTHSP